MLQRKNEFIRGLAVTLIVFGFLQAAGMALLTVIDQKTAIEEENLVREAVRQATVTCYAVEGAYAADLQYLKAHYNLAYNEREFIVSYDAFASNLMPDVRVSRRGARR